MPSASYRRQWQQYQSMIGFLFHKIAFRQVTSIGHVSLRSAFFTPTGCSLFAAATIDSHADG